MVTLFILLLLPLSPVSKAAKELPATAPATLKADIACLASAVTAKFFANTVFRDLSSCAVYCFLAASQTALDVDTPALVSRSTVLKLKVRPAAPAPLSPKATAAAPLNSASLV